MGGACIKCTLKRRSSAESSSTSSSKASAGVSTSPSFRSISLASSGEPHNDSSVKSTIASGGWSPITRKSSSSNRLVTVQPSKEPSLPDCSGILQYENDIFGMVDHRKDGEQALVFIYGGPGSKKGYVIENLMSTYDFYLLSCEELILRRLPGLVERRARKDGLVFTPQHVIGGGCFDGECINEDEKMSQNLLGDIKEEIPTWYTQGGLSRDPIRRLKMMMKDYPEELSLHWVLEQVVEEIASKFSSKNAYILVDLLPNFQFLLDISSFSLRNCAQEMLWLERKFPCLFALYLDTTDENCSDKLVSPPKSPVRKENDTSCIKSEIDEAKRKRRQVTYHEVVQPHLQHFRGEHRLVTVNVCRASREHTWWHVNELFFSLFFTPRAAHHTVVIFASNEHDVQVDCSKAQTALKLTLDKNAYQSEEVFLKDLKDKLTASPMSDRAVVVICEADRLMKLQMKHKKRIKFVENGDPFTRFLVGEGHHCVVNYEADSFKAISAPGDLICCFPNMMHDKLCRRMTANASHVFRNRLVL